MNNQMFLPGTLCGGRKTRKRSSFFLTARAAWASAAEDVRSLGAEQDVATLPACMLGWSQRYRGDKGQHQLGRSKPPRRGETRGRSPQCDECHDGKPGDCRTRSPVQARRGVVRPRPPGEIS